MLRPVVVLSLVLALASSAAAQTPTADELIEHGVALREDGRDAEALAMFQRAFETSASGQAMAQIALAEHALGQLVDAETHLVEALASTGDRFVRRNRELLEQALEEIRTQLTDLTLTGGVPGAQVLLEGAVRGTMPLASSLRVQAGTAHLEIRAEGYLSFTSEVIVNSGTPITLPIALEPVPAVAPVVTEPEPVVTPSEPPASAERANAWMLPVGIALAAAGVVGIGIGSGLMAWREDNARARLTCMDSDPACRAHYGTAVDAEAAGIATYVVSGLLAAGGAVLIVLDVLGSSPSGGAELACSPGLLSLSCAARF